MSAGTMPALDDATFDEVVRAGSGLIAVEFGAEWCGACRVMEPALAAAAAELEGRVRFVSVDADYNPRVVTRFGVRGLPTLLLFRDGELIDRMVGAQSKGQLMTRLTSALDGITRA